MLFDSLSYYLRKRCLQRRLRIYPSKGDVSYSDQK